jgi:hypothetical protein
MASCVQRQPARSGIDKSVDDQSDDCFKTVPSRCVVRSVKEEKNQWMGECDFGKDRHGPS